MSGDLYQINVIVDDLDEENVFVTVSSVRGEGVPPGGDEGQALVKVTDDDFDIGWDFVTGVPDGGTINQTLIKNSGTNGDASWKNVVGFTFVQDTVPTPTRPGETFYDTSTGSTGGSAFVALDNGSGGLIWVQFAPGTAALLDSIPRGIVGYNHVTANQTSISTVVDLTGLSITFNQVAGRRYKISAHVLIQAAAVLIGTVFITDSSNVVMGESDFSMGSLEYATFTPSVVFTAASTGSVTYKLRGAASSSVIGVVASATYKSYILAEDIGVL